MSTPKTSWPEVVGWPAATQVNSDRPDVSIPGGGHQCGARARLRRLRSRRRLVDSPFRIKMKLYLRAPCML
jgi:hypothetical protein